MGRLICVASGKGGVGKSTVAAGLSVLYAAAGRRVLLIDLDAGLRCQDLLLGVTDQLVFDWSDVLSGARELREAVYSVSRCANLELLAAPAEPCKPDAQAFKTLFQTAVRAYDLVILDFPAGLLQTGFQALPPLTQALVVVNPEPVSLRDAQAAGNRLRQCGVEKIGLVINKFDRSAVRGGRQPNVDQMIDQTGLQLLAILPLDARVPLDAAKSRPLKTGRAAMALRRLAARLDGEDIPLISVRQL